MQHLKQLLFNGHYNDLFDQIQHNLPQSDSLQLRFYSLKQKWQSRDNNFNEDTWKAQMLEFVKELSRALSPENPGGGNTAQQLENALAAGNLAEFIRLLDNLPQKDKHNNLIIGFKARYNSLQREIHDGVLTREDQRIEQRRLEQAAQYLLQQLMQN